MKTALMWMAAGAALVIVGLVIYAGVNRKARVAADAEYYSVSTAEFLRQQKEIYFAGDLADCVKLSRAQKEHVWSEAMTDYQRQSYLFAIATPDQRDCQDRARRFCESHYPGDCLAVAGEVRGHRE